LQDQVQIEDELEPEREATLDFAVSSPAPAPAPFFKLNNEKSKRTFFTNYKLLEKVYIA
jgi:hypothetical protein